MHAKKTKLERNSYLEFYHMTCIGTRGRGYCHMGYIGMCHREGYGFQAVYPRIEYINQSVWD